MLHSDIAASGGFDIPEFKHLLVRAKRPISLRAYRPVPVQLYRRNYFVADPSNHSAYHALDRVLEKGGVAFNLHLHLDGYDLVRDDLSVIW